MKTGNADILKGEDTTLYVIGTNSTSHKKKKIDLKRNVIS